MNESNVGLTQPEVKQRPEKFGYNELMEKTDQPVVKTADVFQQTEFMDESARRASCRWWCGQ